MQSQIPSAKKIWITGASTGIGAAVAKQLLDEGCELVISARNVDALQPLVDAYPERCFALRFDVGDDEALPAARELLTRTVKHLDAVIINAGTCEYVEVQQFSAALVRRVVNTNLIGAANTLELALPLLRAGKGSAQIIAISSMATLLPFPRSEAYGASKAGFEYLFSSLRVDVAADDISVSIVRPGFVKTPLTDRNDFPMPFLLSATEAAARIVRGMHKRQPTISFPWQLVFIMKLIRSFPAAWQMALLKRMSRNHGARHASL